MWEDDPRTEHTMHSHRNKQRGRIRESWVKDNNKHETYYITVYPQFISKINNVLQPQKLDWHITLHTTECLLHIYHVYI